MLVSERDDTMKKMRTVKLEVMDLDEGLCAQKQGVLRGICAKPRREMRVVEGRAKHDWRDAVRVYLRRQFPGAWVYRGGHHVSLHASPPVPQPMVRTSFKSAHFPSEAGRCLGRICEAR